MKNQKCDCDKGTRTCDRCHGKGDSRDIIAKAELPESMIESCRWCYGTGTVSCRICNGGLWIDTPEPQNSIERWELHNKWIAVVREVVAKQNRNIAPTKRLVTAIIKAFNDDKISVYWHPDSYGFYDIVITYDDHPHFVYAEDRLTISWSKGIGQERYAHEVNILDHPSWAKLDEELNREDTSDYLERIKQEKTCAAVLDQINGQIMNLEEQIAALRGAADHVLAELPIPESATVRNTETFWDHPTIYAKTKFSAIWPPSK